METVSETTHDTKFPYLCNKKSDLICLCYVSGYVTWDEYRAKFLASKGFNEKEVAEKIKNNEELKVDEESKLGCCVSGLF